MPGKKWYKNVSDAKCGKYKNNYIIVTYLISRSKGGKFVSPFRFSVVAPRKKKHITKHSTQ